MKRRVAHFISASTYGGCEQVALTLLGGLDPKRWSPILLHDDHPGLGRLIEEAGALGIPTRAVPAGKAGAIASIGAFAQLLRAEAPTVFHAHLNWPLSCRQGLLAAKLVRTPAVVATSHLYAPLTGVRFAKIKHRMQVAAIDRYLAVSNEVRRHLVDDLGVAGSKITVIRNGIRTEPFEESADPVFRALLTRGDDRPIVFTPARLHSQKGHEDLLKAAVSVPNAQFLLAGDGPERNRLESMVSELGLGDRVHFLGHRKDIARLMVNCDLFVLPSHYEGLPLTVLEAMAAGRPVIATRVGGTDEAVEDGVSGKLVPPSDPDTLSAAINSLLQNRQVAAHLASAGRTRVRQLFSSQQMVRQVETVYDSLLSNRAMVNSK